MSASKKRRVERISTVAAETEHQQGRPPLLRISLAVVRGSIAGFLSYQSIVRLASVCRELLPIRLQRRGELISTLLPRLPRVCSGECLIGGRVERAKCAGIAEAS